MSQSPKSAVDGAQNDSMETEALGEDFSNTEAIVGACEDMCSGNCFLLVSVFFIQIACIRQILISRKDDPLLVPFDIDIRYRDQAK